MKSLIAQLVALTTFGISLLFVPGVPEIIAVVLIPLPIAMMTIGIGIAYHCDMSSAKKEIREKVTNHQNRFLASHPYIYLVPTVAMDLALNEDAEIRRILANNQAIAYLPDVAIQIANDKDKEVRIALNSNLSNTKKLDKRIKYHLDVTRLENELLNTDFLTWIEQTKNNLSNLSYVWELPVGDAIR